MIKDIFFNLDQSNFYLLKHISSKILKNQMCDLYSLAVPDQTTLKDKFIISIHQSNIEWN